MSEDRNDARSRRPYLFIAAVVTLFVVYLLVFWIVTNPALDRNRLGSELCGDSPGEVCPTDEGGAPVPPGPSAL